MPLIGNDALIDVVCATIQNIYPSDPGVQVEEFVTPRVRNLTYADRRELGTNQAFFKGFLKGCLTAYRETFYPEKPAEYPEVDSVPRKAATPSTRRYVFDEPDKDAYVPSDKGFVIFECATCGGEIGRWMPGRVRVRSYGIYCSTCQARQENPRRSGQRFR